MLTVDELRTAADCAEKYPAGYGQKWGFGDLDLIWSGDVVKRLLHDPSQAKYG